MTSREILGRIKKQFGTKIKDVFEKSYKRVFIEIDSKDLMDITRVIFGDMGARFNTASCTDMPKAMEILYHFTFDEACLVLSVRTYVDKKRPEVASITPLMKGALWIEREIHELFGVNFKGHPNLKRLLLPDDWPEGLHPLRRDYKEEDYTKRKCNTR